MKFPGLAPQGREVYPRGWFPGAWELRTHVGPQGSGNCTRMCFPGVVPQGLGSLSQGWFPKRWEVYPRELGASYRGAGNYEHCVIPCACEASFPKARRMGKDERLDEATTY